MEFFKIPLTWMLLFVSVAVSAQKPMPINIIGEQDRMACPPGQQNFAGSVTFGAITAQSNDIGLDTIFLCRGDMVEMMHNGDAVLTGDPNPLTRPGVGYAFYRCRPTINGPDRNTIATDPCLVTTPPPPGAPFYVSSDGHPNYNLLLNNTGAINATFNGGAPGLYYFAPITFDSLAVVTVGPNTVRSAVYESGGPCVNANVNAAFAVVYLNPILVSGSNGNAGNFGCDGSFRITGGLPEWRANASYTVEITKATDPSVTGYVNNGPVRHNQVARITVPEPGVYNVVIRDGKSCGTVTTLNINTCTGVTFSLPDTIGLPGQNLCLGVTVENFVNVASVQYTLSYDPSILTYTGANGANTNLPGFNIGNANNPSAGIITLSWNNLGSSSNLPDGATMINFCFNVIGPLGNCSPLSFSGNPVANEVINGNTQEIAFINFDGSVCLSQNLNIQLSQTPVTCSGGSNGSFTTAVTGGILPYNINWQSVTNPTGFNGSGIINVAGSTFTQSNLPAGAYTVTVTDGSGRTGTQVVNILPGQALGANIVFNSPQCFGQNTGRVTANVLVGNVIVNPPTGYTFNWNPTAANLPVLNNVGAGPYSVTITAPNGCTATASATMPSPAPIIPTINTTNASCSGINNGLIVLNIIGGTPDINGHYSIFWPTVGGGLSVQNSMSRINNIVCDDYPLYITDSNGCSDTTIVDLMCDKTLTVNAQVLDETCFSSNNGRISANLSVTGGISSGVTFTWGGTPAPPAAVTVGNNSVISPLFSGTYFLTVRDNQGCNVTETYVLDPKLPFVIDSIFVQDASCLVGNNGSLRAEAIGGTPPYTYAWATTPVQTTQTAINLAAGVYNLTITDANGCTIDGFGTVNTEAAPIVTMLTNDTLNCFNGTDGTLTVVANGNGSNITSYNWQPGSLSGGTISNLSPNTYTVTITNANGCTTTASAVVVAPPPVRVDSSQFVSPSCPGGTNGSASVFVSGGTAPYRYTWSNNPGVPTNFNLQPGLGAGTYTVTISDFNNCLPPTVATVIVQDPPRIQVAYSAIDSVSCNQSLGVPCDGIATATASYSDNSAGTFNFIWESGQTNNNTNSSSSNQLCQGWQTVTVSQVGGAQCVHVDSVFIPAPPRLSGQLVEAIDASCNGDTDGSLQVQGQGGTGAFNYIWSHGPTGALISNLAPNGYQVDIFDAKNCRFTLANLQIEEPDELLLLINAGNTFDPNCFESEDGIITLEYVGGNDGPVAYDWSNNVAASNSNRATELGAGTYYVTITDIKGCSDSVSVTLTEPSAIGFDLAAFDPILCFGFQTFVTVDTAFGGTLGQFVFSVDNAPVQTLNTAVPIFAGQHTIRVFDINNCVADTTFSVGQPPEIVVDLPDMIEVELGDSIRLRPQTFSLLPTDSIFWTPAFQLSCIDCLEPTVRPIVPETYTLTIWDENGCSGADVIFVDVDANRNVYVPNIFSPGGNGINDVFRIFTGKGVSNITSLRVFDRWGGMMYFNEQLDPNVNGTVGWDGTFRGEDVPSGVFVYIFDVLFEDGVILTYKGDLTLLRGK